MRHEVKTGSGLSLITLNFSGSHYKQTQEPQQTQWEPRLTLWCCPTVRSRGPLFPGRKKKMFTRLAMKRIVVLIFIVLAKSKFVLLEDEWQFYLTDE